MLLCNADARPFIVSSSLTTKAKGTLLLLWLCVGGVQKKRKEREKEREREREREGERGGEMLQEEK